MGFTELRVEIGVEFGPVRSRQLLVDRHIGGSDGDLKTLSHGCGVKVDKSVKLDGIHSAKCLSSLFLKLVERFRDKAGNPNTSNDEQL